MQIVDVLIEYSIHSLNRPFSYLYSGHKNIAPGYRVLINFHNKEIVGYVLKITDTDKNKDEIEEEYGFSMEEITSVLDDAPLLNKDLLELSDKLTDYYLSTKINILQTMLPPSLSPRRSTLRAPKIAYDQYFSIIDENEDGLTAKQIELLRFIKQEGKVLKRNVSAALANKLLEANKIEIIKEEKRRLAIPDFEYRDPPILTDDQKTVVNEFDNSSDRVYLLEGITGSGKTEVYLSLCEKTLNEERSILMLVPEISLTPMMVEYFLRRFKNKVAVLHSGLTAAEKYDEYRKIANGDCKIVVGARSAVFAPLQNIGLIILDEEHTESYKQDVAPFYHAREVAIMRAEMHNAKVILGSATPSLETRARAQNGVYHLLKLHKRINNQPLPNTQIVNLLDYHNIDKSSILFSKQLRNELQKVLDKHEQAILLINRRGFSTNVSCRNCGHVFKCPNCGVPLTYHKADNMLKCHHCDYVEPMASICPECESKYLMKTGFGTEKIEEEVKRLFPSARTLRLDSDSAKIRTKIPETIEAFRKKEADILIGTQMIAKGHDFPEVTLVGVVLADIGLSMPSYRSSERAFELIAQAIGRAGRSDKKGIAIVQTYLPDHYSISLASKQDYESFYAQEMKLRKLQFYPPYAYLASITISSKNEEKVMDVCEDIKNYFELELGKNARVLGPSDPLGIREINTISKCILLKYKDNLLVHNCLANMLKIFGTKSDIKLSVNIDPYNF